MDKQFEILRKTRAFLVQLTNELSLEQLNAVPSGFSNNIIWNMGHVIAAQQGVCYRRANLPLLIEDRFFERYKPETKPVDMANEAELENIRELLFSTIDQLEADYRAGIFGGYVPWKTRYGVAIDTIEDAITFLAFHDGLHIGYSMALRRCILK